MVEPDGRINIFQANPDESKLLSHPLAGCTTRYHSHDRDETNSTSSNCKTLVLFSSVGVVGGTSPLRFPVRWNCRFRSCWVLLELHSSFVSSDLFLQFGASQLCLPQCIYSFAHTQGVQHTIKGTFYLENICKSKISESPLHGRNGH